jgi:hypothetical protein
MKNFIIAAVVVGMFTFANSAQAGPLRCLAGKVLVPVKDAVEAQPVRSGLRCVASKKPVRATTGRVFGGCRTGSCAN